MLEVSTANLQNDLDKPPETPSSPKEDKKVVVSSETAASESDKPKSDSVANCEVDQKIEEEPINVLLRNDKKEENDIVLIRKDPQTNRASINKSAYAKLQRSFANRSSIGIIKEKYETPALTDKNSTSMQTSQLVDNEINVHQLLDNTKNNTQEQAKIEEKTRISTVKFDDATVELLKTKYSPANFGYPKQLTNSRLPIPRTRSLLVKSEIIDTGLKTARHSLPPNTKDENSNLLYDKSDTESVEYIPIVTRSESEQSIDLISNELNQFMMDKKPKEKKRSNSFKKIFSAGIFGKDKKKREEKSKNQNVEYAVHSDNMQNETNIFSRQSPYRHTTGGASKTKEVPVNRIGANPVHPNPMYRDIALDQKYAQMHINKFNSFKKNFEEQGEDYVDMGDKQNVKKPPTYMNMPYVNKYIDTSSSASTLESDKPNVFENDLNSQQIASNKKVDNIENPFNKPSTRYTSSGSSNRDTPPRLQETRQDVKLVNPKALIPINSERPLPNPYQNNLENSTPRTTENNLNKSNFNTTSLRPRLEETYGTVFDKVDYTQGRNSSRQQIQANSNLVDDKKPPKSPSLELTKLKLPPNREIIPLEPRVKSPIPHDKVSTEKLIATELLKGARSPTLNKKMFVKTVPPPSHQNLEIDIDYPDNFSQNNQHGELSRNIIAKPPILPKPSPVKRMDLAPQSPNYNSEKITTNAMVHINSPTLRTPTPNSLLRHRSLSPMTTQSVRSSTPVDLRLSPSVKTSPQKEEIRKNVEAYYWKEIKKLKEQETYDYYTYQMQYGFAEDPVVVRRSRSLSPTAHRSRRALSLPRDVRPPQNVQYVQGASGNTYIIQPQAIPEGRAVVNQVMNPRNSVQYQGQNFVRNLPDRRTFDGNPNRMNYENYNNSLYRPIFKRGSLTKQMQEDQALLANKKVSFSSSNNPSPQSWPTKNGYTKSPPQRRIDKLDSVMDDEVFFPPNTPRSPQNMDPTEIYGYNYPPPRQVYNNANVDVHNRESSYMTKSQILEQNARLVQARMLEDEMYGQPVDYIKPTYGLRRHGSIQMNEPVYGARRFSYDSVNFAKQNFQEPQYVSRNQLSPQVQRPMVPQNDVRRREVIVNENDIFGQIGGYKQQTTPVPLRRSTNEEIYIQQRNNLNSIYSSRQSVNDSIYGRSGGPRQVSMRNKVCDIYGQIHENEDSYGQIQKTGVIVGQLYRNPGSPAMVRHNIPTQVPNGQFVRGSRLTASANDMYRRYQNADPRYQSDIVYTRYQIQGDANGAPNRPLPPVPSGKKGVLRNFSDTESASDVSDVRGTLSSGTKNKKRSFFGGK